MCVLKRHLGIIQAVHIYDNGHRCVSGSYDGTLCIWDLDAMSTVEVIPIMHGTAVVGINVSKAVLESIKLKNKMMKNGAIVE